MRGLSQNVTFMGGGPEQQSDEPPGLDLAEQLIVALRPGSAAISDPDNWRDSGWSFKAKVADVEEEIVVARAPTGAWFIQVAPARASGLLQHLFGPKEHPAIAATFEVARSIHHVLVADGRFSGFRWRWDGPPADHDAQEPTSRPAG